MIDWLTAMKDLDAQPLSPVYTLLGSEHYLVRKFTEAVRDRLTKTTGQTADLNRFSFDDDGPDLAVAACETVSLFATAAVQVLDNCLPLLAGAKVKSGKVDTSRLETYLERPADAHILIVTAYGEKFDERKKLVKLAKQHVVVNCTPPNDQAALCILRGAAKELRIDATEEAVSELMRRAGAVSLAVAELQKVAIYAGQRQVQRDDVEALVLSPPEDNVFHWVDLAVRGNVQAALFNLEDVLTAGNDPFGLIALLARQLRLIWYALYGQMTHVNPRDVAARVGAPPFALKIALEQSRGLTLARIEHLLTLVADAEFDLKSGRREARQALEWLVLYIAAARENRQMRAN